MSVLVSGENTRVHIMKRYMPQLNCGLITRVKNCHCSKAISD